MAAGTRLARTLPYAIVGAAACYLYYIAMNFEFHRRAGTLGPDFWPKAILALLIATCAYEIGRRVFSRSPHKEVGGVLEELVEASAETHGNMGGTAAAESHPWLLAAGMALTALYVFSIQTLGFTLATATYLALFITLGGYRRWGVIAATSVLGTLLLLFFFMKVVYVSLPIGEAPFSAVTLFLMQVMGIR
ncbi:MAG: tripartite tricarboxylate transporter TctB family protein [Burkholderiales bacterium]|nr:tripartite tricarboxylate transporter TctB family protein [Burkholderiales bacterium]